MGHLVVMDDSEAQFALTAFSRRLWTERAASLPPEVEDDPCGTLWVAADEEEMARRPRGRRPSTRRAARGSRSSTPAALREAEPQLRPGLAGALRVPGDRVVYPPAAARALPRAAPGASASRSGRACASRRSSRAGRAAAAAWREADADVVVNAAGAEAPRLVPALPIAPRKGHLVITDRYPGFLRHQVIELGYLRSAHALTRESVAFNVQPRRTGQLLVGSSRELVGWDASINRPLRARMLRRAAEYLPGPRAARTRCASWVGFRPATPDHLPLVGDVGAGALGRRRATRAWASRPRPAPRVSSPTSSSAGRRPSTPRPSTPAGPMPSDG